MARGRLVDPNAEESLAPNTGTGAQGERQAPLPRQAEDVLLGDDVPEQFRGKSSRDLLGVVQNQASLIGRQSQEVGQLREETRRLREMVDRAITTQLPGEKGKEQAPLTKEDFWDKPDEVVPRVVESQLKDRDARLDRLESRSRQIDFDRAHPTAAKDVNDPDFVAFVQKSARRERLALQAFKDPNNINYDAAEALWEMWDEVKALRAETRGTTESTTPAGQTPETRTHQSPPPAVRGSSSGGDPDRAAHTPQGKIWTETELLAMQEKDPDSYWALAASGEIDKAWREKRVKRQGT